MTSVVEVTTPSELTIVEGSSTTTIDITTPVGATVTAAASGPQGVPGTTPIYTRVGELAPLQGKGRFYFEQGCVIGKVRAAVGTAPTGAPVVIDVNVNGSSIYANQANRPSIAAGSNTTTSTPGWAVTAGDYITVDIDSVGTINPGADLTVTVSIA